MYRDTTNVEPEMYDYTGNNWSLSNSNEKLKEKPGSCTRKTFDRFTTKDSCTWNITHNTESTAVWTLKPERWGSPLVQEKYRGEKACDRRHSCRTIIINKPPSWCRNMQQLIYVINGVSLGAYVGRYINSWFVSEALPRSSRNLYIFCAGDINQNVPTIRKLQFENHVSVNYVLWLTASVSASRARIWSVFVCLLKRHKFGANKEL